MKASAMAQAPAFRFVLGFIGAMWIVFALDLALPIEGWGIRPRQWSGLLGIATAPFIHSNIPHLAANSTSLLVFGMVGTLLEGRRFASIAAGAALIGGLLTWLFARSANYVGASGVIFGLFGYLLFLGYFNRRWPFVLASAACLIGFGSMIFGVLPGSSCVSWESHLFGFSSGAFMAKRRRAA